MAIPAIAILLSPSPLLATTMLGSAQSFAVLGASAITNASASAVFGDVGVTPGTSITGMGDITLTGTVDDGNDVARQAEIDAGTAFVQLSALTPTMDLTGHDLGSVGVLTPGVYNFSSSAELTGTLTLDFAGAPDSPFVFQIGSTLTTASGSDVAILNGDADSQVYFVVGSSATLGTGTTFAGNILASQSVTMNSGADIMCGRAIALNAAVSMGGNSVSNGCSGPGDLGGGRRDFGSGGYSGGAGGVPEPAPWATMLLGFGGLGLATRRDRDRRIVSGRPAPNGVF